MAKFFLILLLKHQNQFPSLVLAIDYWHEVEWCMQNKN